MYYTVSYNGGRSPIYDDISSAATPVSTPETSPAPTSEEATPDTTTPTPSDEELFAKLDDEFAAKQQRDAERRAAREMLFEQLSPYEIRLDKALVEPKPILARGKAVIGSEGNLSAIVGEAKSKKSFLCTAMVGDMLSLALPPTSTNGFNNRAAKVLWVDTEQSELHVRKIARRLSALTGWADSEKLHPFLKLYALREEPPKERLRLLLQAIEAWQPKLIVIDGIADLQHNTNDLEESERIITQLMAISSLCRCHILCVLHTNPNSDKARGHVGSALQRKAETVLYVHKVGEKSVVEPQFCRNEPFERFAFVVSNEQLAEGLPCPASLPTEGEQRSDNELITLVREAYGGAVERSVLIKRLEERYTSTNANVKVSRALKRGELLLSEDRRLVMTPEVARESQLASPPNGEECPF